MQALLKNVREPYPDKRLSYPNIQPRNQDKVSALFQQNLWDKQVMMVSLSIKILWQIGLCLQNKQKVCWNKLPEKHFQKHIVYHSVGFSFYLLLYLSTAAPLIVLLLLGTGTAQRSLHHQWQANGPHLTFNMWLCMCGTIPANKTQGTIWHKNFTIQSGLVTGKATGFIFQTTFSEIVSLDCSSLGCYLIQWLKQP